jgi:hypothetical protein
MYAEATCAKVPNYGPFLPTTTRLCNQDGKLIAGGTFLTQAYGNAGAANRRPKGVGITSIQLTRPTAASDGQATATLTRPASYAAGAHSLSALLADATTGEPVALDYAASTSVSADGRTVTLKIPAGTAMPASVSAWAIADVFPLGKRTL